MFWFLAAALFLLASLPGPVADRLGETFAAFHPALAGVL